MMRVVGLITVACLLALAAPSRAQDKAEAAVSGVLEATTRDRLPADASFEVRPATASPMAQAMRDAFIAALRDAGHKVGGERHYTLSFQLTGDVPDYASRPDVELVGEGGSSNLEDVELKMRWRLSRGDGEPTKSRLLLLTITDPDKNIVWEARATIKATEASEFEIVNAVAPRIVANLGQQVLGTALP